MWGAEGVNGASLGGALQRWLHLEAGKDRCRGWGKKAVCTDRQKDRGTQRWGRQLGPVG